MNLSLIYPFHMTMLEYVAWAKTPAFDKAIAEVIRCELSHVDKGANRILLAHLRCYEIAAELIVDTNEMIN
jgi:hypothetical protein